MKISVIIPTFNRHETIARALDSVLTQTETVDEIIVIDDGSSDETVQLISEKYAQIIYIPQLNQGVSAARNTGIKEAKSEWIALLDSDDEWMPDKISNQRQALELSQDQFCHTEEIWVRNGKRVNAMKKHQKPDGWIFNASLPLCCVSPSSALIHRSIFDSLGLFDETLPACEDYDMWLRIFSRYRATLVNKPLLVKHGGHSDQLSRQYWGMDRFRVQALMKILDEGHLSLSDQTAALSMLVLKFNVLVKGCIKRDKQQQASEYLVLQDKYKKRFSV